MDGLLSGLWHSPGGRRDRGSAKGQQRDYARARVVPGR